MPSTSTNIPDCQPPATNAEGVMAVTPNAGGGVGPYILFADCDGNRLAVGDTVEVLTLPGTRLVIVELLLSPISVVVDGKITFPVCEFVYVDQGGILVVFYASKVKKIEPVPTAPAVNRWQIAPTCCADTDDELIAGWLSRHLPVAVQLELIDRLLHRQLKDQAAAHAYEMQSGGVANG